MMSSEPGSFYADEYTKPGYLAFKPDEEHNQCLITPDTRNLSTPVVDRLLVTSATHTHSRGFFQPDPVTAEQEMYAQPFLDALQHRFQQEGTVSTPDISCPSSAIPHPSYVTAVGSNPSLEMAAPTYVTATMSDLNNLLPSDPRSTFPVTTSHEGFAAGSYMPSLAAAYSHPHATDAYPAVIPGFNVIAHAATSSQGAIQSQGYGSHSHSPSMSQDMLRQIVPADMKTMESMKLERKKARNRIAASKCRQRRLQRESDLQEKVRRLRDHNQELNNELSSLKEKVHNLKRVLMKHVSTGCHVDIPEDFRSESISSTSSE